MKASLKTTLLAALLGMASATQAQPSPAQLHMQQQQQNQNLGGMIQSDNMRRCGNPTSCRVQENAAAQRRARERQLQQEIAELRRTPFYMAIAYDFTNKLVLRGGYYSEKRAIEEALDQCKSSNCQIVTTFANTCAMVARPEAGSQTANNWFVAFDNDPQQAIVKSVRACEAKHGNDKCYFWGGLTKTGAFCSGYDYSLYGHR